MRIIDADALKKVISNNPLIDFTDDDIFDLIDNAPIVSDRYGEGYAQGYIDGSTGADWKGGADMRGDNNG